MREMVWIRSTRFGTTLVLSLALSLLTGCAAMGAGNANTQPSSSVAVTPATGSVRAGDTLQFTAKVSGTVSQAVVWSVNGVVGGNATDGMISATGKYTAPATLPNPNSISIEATSSSDKSLSGKSMITLENPVPTVTGVSPTAVAVGNFSITISGSKFVSGARVMFGTQALTTKFVSSSQLTATGTATTAQQGMSIQVTVVNPDPGSIASSTMAVKVNAPQTPQIVVKITPASAQLHPGQTVQFKATVTGTTNQNVVWQVNSTPGGNATVGTISSTGLYTAPAVLPKSTSLTINAVSAADSHSTSAASAITLLSNIPVVTAALPTPIPVGNFTISVAQAIQSNGNPTQLLNGFGGSTDSNARLSALQSLLTFDTGLSLIQAASTTTGNAIQNGQSLATALASGTPLATQFPQNSYFASQLQQVAKIIQVRSALGLRRQIFFVSMGGFDTHSGQLPQQDSLFNDLNQSLSAFYQATVEMGVAPNVTTFTLSDFGRTYQPNSDGTDHAWGGHHIIMGGAVKGGDFYGTFPTLAVNGPDDATGQGRWVPTTSLDQYAATLASWFGVAAADLPSIFPNLANFTTPTLGIMG